MTTSNAHLALPEKIAILVDGGFYLYRAHELFGEKSGSERADELVEYCLRHLRGTSEREQNYLYRIFYYDCPPINSPVWHPFLQKQINMGQTDRHRWSTEFLDCLSNKRKVAIRLGELQERDSAFRLRDKTMRKLCSGEKSWDEVGQDDFELNLVQKGVDMRIGLDISSLAYKKQVTRIVLIAGDSDFVPAAKHARREGIDFILDPMWQGIKTELNKHIDGLHSCVSKRPTPSTEPLCKRQTIAP